MAKMAISDFSTEVLTRIFLELSYKSLLSVLAVSVQWNTIVVKDPALRVQMFKKRSTVYVEPGCREPAKAGLGLNSSFAEPTRLHPAVQQASCTIGDGVEAVSFYTGGEWDDNPKLAKLAIANDFLSIPAVTVLKIELAPNFNVTAKNAKGVKVVDLFTAIEKEASRKVKTRRGSMERYEMLGDHRFYEGLSTLIRIGQELRAQACLGS
ncbi:hypothetical protein FB451DRAFT_440910 [Mycena latifolia]|nr:hypothetical protein FB451DRAFT_440910 [Mycena latifolia]